MKSEPKRRRRATEDHTAHFWAYEFLKRNSRFRAAVKDLQGLAGPKNDPGSPWRRRWRQIADEFGVAFPMLKEWRTDFDSPVMMKTAPAYVPSFRLGQAREYHHVEREEGWKLVLFFDLRLPTGPQIARARWLVNENRGSRRIKIEKGTQRDRFPDFARLLRILDLRIERKSYGQIAAELFPGEDAVDRVKKLNKEAERLRDNGYRYLASIRQRPGFLSKPR